MDYMTPSQCRAARALLNWGQPELARRCGVHVQTISNFEQESGTPTKRTLQKISSTLENAGVEFISPHGVNIQTSYIKRLEGRDGFSAFLDDVYQTIITHGTKAKPVQVFLSNVVHENWIKCIGPDKWENHRKRMTDKRDLMDIRIIVKENDWHFPASDYAQYKWCPEAIFNDKSFYSYYDKLAFLNFREGDAEVIVMQQRNFAEGYRNLFMTMWNHVAISPPIKKVKNSNDR